MAVKSLIETVTVGAGGAASIEFTDIPQDGSDLVLVMSLRSNRAYQFDPIAFLLNNSSSGFTGKYVEGDGSIAYSSTNTNASGLANGNTATANTFGNSTLYISNYAGSAHKSISGIGVSENNAGYSGQNLYSISWANTAAITAWKIIPQASSLWLQYSTASLYKIKYD